MIKILRFPISVFAMFYLRVTDNTVFFSWEGVSRENANFMGKNILENETDHASKIIQHVKYI